MTVEDGKHNQNVLVRYFTCQGAGRSEMVKYKYFPLTPLTETIDDILKELVAQQSNFLEL